MTGRRGVLRWLKETWPSAWPVWSLLAFASLAVLRFLPAGYIRALPAAPILLIVPGSLTVSAVFGERRRPQGLAFLCYAALLGAIWIAFASLALYVLGVRITAGSTYWCLLTVSTVLAIAAEVRLWLGSTGGGRRVALRRVTNRDLSDAEAQDARMPPAARRGVLYPLVALVAGACLLAGGLYAYEHVPGPKPVGYSFIAWTGPTGVSSFAVGPTGIELHFQIVDHESDRTTFQLAAEWLGTPSRPLADPVILSIGPRQTFRGSIFVPPLPDGCSYRIILSLTASQLIDPQTKKPRAWSIDADVRDPSKSAKACS